MIMKVYKYIFHRKKEGKREQFGGKYAMEVFVCDQVLPLSLLWPLIPVQPKKAENEY